MFTEGKRKKKQEGEGEVDQVVTIQEWVHVSKVCGLFVRHSCLMLYPEPFSKVQMVMMVMEWVLLW